jgi:EmrB/QacA subfamily drug resistance transporter
MGTSVTGTRNRGAALAVLCLSVLIVTVDNTILNVALPTLVRDLGATSSQLQWIVDSYALVLAGLMLVTGSIADRVGRRRVFLAGMVTFAGASTCAAYCDSVTTLVIARAAMGVGAALILPATLSLITNLFPEQDRRQRAYGIWAAMSGLGIAIGPISGGVLLDHFWWGSVFLVNLPIATIGLVGALCLVPDSQDPQARRPDPVGSLSSIVGLALLLWAIIEAPDRGWTAVPILAAGLASLLVLTAFALWERRIEDPMLDLAAFGRRSYSGAVVCVGLGIFGLFGALFVLTQFLQFNLGYAPTQAGVRILPVALVLGVVAPLSNVVVPKAGVAVTMACGLLAVAAGLALLSRTTTGSSYGDALPGMLLLGFGAGLLMPTGIGSAMASIAPERAGVASASVGVSVQTGGALGVAVIGSLLSARYQERMTQALAPHDLPDKITDTVLGSVGSALQVAQHVGEPAASALRTAARSAFVSGLGLGFAAAAAVVACSALVALAWLPRTPQTPLAPRPDEPRPDEPLTPAPR